MAKKLRPISHDDRLSVVDHLDELRSRLIVCVAALVVAFALSFWQNDRLIRVLDHAVPVQTATSAQQHAQRREATGAREVQQAASALARSTRQSAADRANFQLLARGAGDLEAGLHDQAAAAKPIITIGVSEPFTTTMAIAFYFALLFTLPVLLYQAYAYILPAFRPDELSGIVPVMVMAPVLFLAGVAFAYFEILPPAVEFLQHFNSSNFTSLIQARPYYEFEILVMLGVGLTFQLPLGLLALDRLGVITAETLTKHWRYAVVGISIVAAALPGADPITTLLEMVPLLVLYVLSIVLLRIADRRAAARASAEDSGQHGDLDLTH